MNVLKRIREYTSRSEFRTRLVECLIDMCRTDTCPSADLRAMRQAEDRVFGIIVDQLNALGGLRGRVVKAPIPGEIEGHPSFSNPFYASTRPGGPRRDTAEVYQDRYNLLYLIDNERSRGGQGVAMNAHVDMVPPFFPPRLEGDQLFGRGTADDKGNAAAILGALSVLNTLVERDGLALKDKITAMFVIDEEMGGNGSLALCLDRGVMDRCDTMLVLECTGTRIHPANRGAVHLACRVELDERGLAERRLSTIESLVYAVLELEHEGDLIRQESNHPLFPHRPVQTCTGIIGEFGDHPSTLCGELTFRLTGLAGLTELAGRGSLKAVAAILRKGLSAYIARHGDKSRTRDPGTGKRKVHHHLSLTSTADGEVVIVVHGSSGHMGSLLKNDSALTKWAYMARELIESRLRGEVSFTMLLGKAGPSDPLVFEGAQGFLPTHGIREIMDRTTAALTRGVRRYLALLNADSERIACRVGFEKLHNDAFSSTVRPATMNRLTEAAVESGLLEQGEALLGWDVSCDARLFAAARSDLPVITCGVGSLEFAHSDKERIALPDLFRFIEFLTYFLVTETGSSLP